MIDLNDMVIFAKVAEAEGISSAARALDMPKSKVSRRMVALESALGVRLLERTTRAVRITEAGQKYLLHCQRVVAHSATALEEIHQLAETPRGHLRVSASVAMGQYCIAPYLSEFMRLYPDISLDLVLNNRRVDLIAEGFDLAIRVGELSDSNLICKPIGSTRAGLYAAPDYLQRNPVIHIPADLREHKTLVMSDANHSQRWVLERAKGESCVVDITPVMSVNDFSCLREVAVQAGGIVQLPYYLADDLVQRGRLERVLPEWHSPVIGYFVLFPSHRGLTRKARVWMEFITAKLEGVLG